MNNPTIPIGCRIATDIQSGMTTHQLAKYLLERPDVVVATRYVDGDYDCLLGITEGDYRTDTVADFPRGTESEPMEVCVL